MKIHPVRSAPAFLSVLLLLTVTAFAFAAQPESETSPAEAPNASDQADPSTDSPSKPTADRQDPEAEADKSEPSNLMRRVERRVDQAFATFNGKVASVMFFDVVSIFQKDAPISIPLAVLWLVMGTLFFTVYMGFINLRAFRHAILVTAGRYDNPEDAGEVTHFQALTAALSATVGLGNIAGVAIAVSIGGPGATLWMIFAGSLGMSAKFVECTLGQKYREVRPDGRVMGGAMFYLSKGLGELGIGPVGKVLAIVFAVLCVGGSFAGGNAFQVNQSLDAVQATIPGLENFRWAYGLVMTVLVGIVIIGGIRRIATTAEKIVPFMCGVYVLAALAILIMNYAEIPAAFSLIFSEAFSPSAVKGGAIGVLVVGFQRAAFSNEAGVGSAAIAHSAAKTDYPVREGLVALLGPFIDTVVICTMTALVIVITGAWNNPDAAYEAMRANNEGAALTSSAMGSQIPYFEYVLAIAVILFAYSTMISWSYYGERCWAYLFGDRASMSYRIIFLAFVFLGSIASAKNVLEFGDLMILGMAFPNILGVVLLAPKVKADLKDYWTRYKSGEFEPK